MALKPVSATVTAEAKFFSLGSGQSTGSTFAITFEWDGEGILSKQLMEAKLRLDRMAVLSECARGAISNVDAKARLASLDLAYKPYLPVIEESHASSGSAAVPESDSGASHCGTAEVLGK